jgi:ribulose-phosphate 3-epimerase
MIERADDYLEAFRDAGADHIIVHQEGCIHLNRTIARIKELGAQAGVALNPATPCSTLVEIISEIDLVLLMSVNPGFGGQKFIKGTLRKLTELRSMISSTGRDIRVAVDGGIDASTAPSVVKAGADVLVAGTAIFRAPNIGQAVKDLRKSVAHLVLA